ncbi:neuropeptides capa receptor-like [Amphiura filiformis]|uniref:neuropeptides capa receptor-like n=1 Tax=Amphiura filiformis TaxID=82378 RepID=UPI003B2247CF
MNSTHSDDDCDILLSEEEAVPYFYTIYKKIFILVIIPIVAGLGILGNAALLFVVYRVPEMRTVTNFYLSNLAVSDITLLIITTIRFMWSYFNTPIEFAFSSFHFGCALVWLITYLCYFASVYLITLVTFERYLAICHPITHRMLKGRTWTVRMTISAWLISLVSASVCLHFYETETICIDWSNSTTFQNIAAKFVVCKAVTNCSWCWPTLAAIDFVQFVLAVILSSYMYGRIIYALSTRTGLTGETSSEKQTTILRTRNQIGRMLILNGIIFFICRGPNEIYNIDDFKYWLVGERMFESKTATTILWFSRVMWLLNSAVNPLVYSVSNQRYRRAFVEAFRRVDKRKKRSSSRNGNENIMISRS